MVRPIYSSPRLANMDPDPRRCMRDRETKIKQSIYWGLKSISCMHAYSVTSNRLWDPMDCSLPGSSVPGIFQARILAWVAISSSRGFSWLRDEARISFIFCVDRQILCPPVCVWSHFKSCLTLCDPMDYSLPGSPVHGILQARILE